MIYKIKRNIILSTLASVLIVLASVVGFLNMANYRNITQDADSILRILADNDGSFPTKIEFSQEDVKVYNSMETPYETRYFSVHIGQLDKIISYDLSNIASVDKDMVTKMISSVLTHDTDSGYIGDYRYLKVFKGNYLDMIIFVDCAKSLAMFRDTLSTSIIYALIGFTLVILLSLFLSKQTMQIYEITDKKQQQFISDAGHEIKTPISVINADVQVLEMDYGENEWCDDIKVQTERLTKLTQNLITLSKMELHSRTESKESIDISSVAKESAQSFVSVAKTREKTYQYEIEENLSLQGTAKEIKELLDILLDNAMKYSSERGDILLEVKKEKGIVIRTTNAVDENVNPEIVLRMFDRFYRGDESHNADVGNEGYGIGLAVAKAITQKYNGNIKAEIKNRQMMITATLK